MKRFFIINFFVLVLFASAAVCQTAQKIEQELVGAIKQLNQYSTYSGNYDEEKLSAANKAFKEKLLKYTKNAATLKYGFPKLGDLVVIATSDDGKLRTYSWDSGTGGTMHDYITLYQYLGANGKIYSRTDEDPAAAQDEEEESGGESFVNTIYAVNTSNGTVYVVCTTAIASSIDHYDAANLYKIEGDKLIDDVKLFKTKEGLTASIGFEYDFFTVAERPGRPLGLILYDKQTKTVKIPIVIVDKNSPIGRVTNRFINYKFDGKYFVRN